MPRFERLKRLIFGVNDLAGFVFIASSQAGSLAGLGVHAIESPIPNTTPD